MYQSLPTVLFLIDDSSSMEYHGLSKIACLIEECMENGHLPWEKSPQHILSFAMSQFLRPQDPSKISSLSLEKIQDFKNGRLNHGGGPDLSSALQMAQKLCSEGSIKTIIVFTDLLDMPPSKSLFSEGCDVIYLVPDESALEYKEDVRRFKETGAVILLDELLSMKQKANLEQSIAVTLSTQKTKVRL